MKHKTYISILFGFAFLLYAQTFLFNYTYYDDYILLVEEQDFWENSPNLWSFFTKSVHESYFTLYYRPLQNITFALDAKISGSIDSPWSFHLTNVFLFALIGCALFTFLSRQHIRPEIAFWTSLFFCANPAFVTAVAWIPARGDLLLTLFSLLTLIGFADFLKKPNLKHLVLTALFFGLALLSKETAVGLPFIFLVWFFLDSENKKPQPMHWGLALALGAAGLAWLWLRSLAIINGFTEITWSTVLNNLFNIPMLFSEVFFPFQPVTLPYFSMAKTMIGSLILTGLVVWALKSNRITKPAKWTSLIWIFIFLWPAITIIPLQGCEYLVHRYMLPATGLFWLLAAFANNVVLEKRYRIFRIGAPLIMGVFSALTIYSSKNYENPETFFGAALKANPNNAMAFNGRGFYRQEALGDMDRAESDYLQALSINPKNYAALKNLALMRAQSGRSTEALDYYNRAISVKQDDYALYQNRGIIKAETGDYKGALTDFDTVLILNPHLDNVRKYRDHLRSILEP